MSKKRKPNMYPDHIITKRLNQLQGDRTLREFADEIGIGQSTLHNYLKGRIPPAGFIEQVCDSCGVTPNWMYGVDPEKDKNAYSKMMVNILTDMNRSIRGCLDLIKGEEK